MNADEISKLNVPTCVACGRRMRGPRTDERGRKRVNCDRCVKRLVKC